MVYRDRQKLLTVMLEAPNACVSARIRCDS